MSENYETTQEWYKHNRHQLKKYRGQWIAYTKDGIIAHHSNFVEMMDSIAVPLIVRTTRNLVSEMTILCIQ